MAKNPRPCSSSHPFYIDLFQKKQKDHQSAVKILLLLTGLAIFTGQIVPRVRLTGVNKVEDIANLTARQSTEVVRRLSDSDELVNLTVWQSTEVVRHTSGGPPQVLPQVRPPLVWSTRQKPSTPASGSQPLRDDTDHDNDYVALPETQTFHSTTYIPQTTLAHKRLRGTTVTHAIDDADTHAIDYLGTPAATNTVYYYTSPIARESKRAEAVRIPGQFESLTDTHSTDQNHTDTTTNNTTDDRNYINYATDNHVHAAEHYVHAADPYNYAADTLHQRNQNTDNVNDPKRTETDTDLPTVKGPKRAENDADLPPATFIDDDVSTTVKHPMTAAIKSTTTSAASNDVFSDLKMKVSSV